MDDPFDAYAPSYVGTIVLAGLWVKPLAILWFISLCLARRKSDPARDGIAWMKAVFPVWIVGSVGDVVATGLFLWNFTLMDGRFRSSFAANYIAQAADHISTTASFLRSLADILLFITFVELASGFLLCLSNGGEHGARRKQLRYAILGWGFVLFAVIVGSFGLSHAITPRVAAANRGDLTMESQDALIGMQLSSIRLQGAVKILFWLTSMPMVALASYAVHKTKGISGLRNTAVLLLVGTILTFVRLLAVMALYAHVWLGHPIAALFGASDTPLAVRLIVNAFFDYVFMFIVLVLLFTLGIRKRQGLWSQPQPGLVFTAGFNTGTLPAGYTMTTAPPPPHPAAANGPPAYMAVAHQQQPQQYQQQHYQQPQAMAWQQQQPPQGQPMYQQQPQQQQGYYYYPPPQQQQQQQPPPVEYQQYPGQQMTMVEPKDGAGVNVQQQQQQPPQ